MTLSPSRTLVVPATPLFTPAALSWPLAYPADALDYSLDVTAPLAEVGDTLLSVAVSAAPSGAGELAVQSVSVAGTVITAMLVGGQPGRRYVVRVVATTLGGRTFEWCPVLQVRATVGDPVAQVAPSTGFGAPASWASGAAVQGGPLVPLALVTAAGTTQAGATVLAAQTSIITAGPANAGVLLPAGAQAGAFTVLNRSGADQLVYPPSGAQIGAAGANAPVLISDGSTVIFVYAGGSQWYA